MTQRPSSGPSTKVFCDKCGEEKEMYYVPWCPACDKPQRKQRETLNLIQALRHIEVVTGDYGTPEKYYLNGYKRRMWEWLISCDAIPRNDSYSAFCRPESLDNDEWSGTEQQRKDVKLFCDTFNITENDILLDISW